MFKWPLTIFMVVVAGFGGWYMWKNNLTNDETQSSGKVVTSNDDFTYEVFIPYEYKLDKNASSVESVDIKVNSDNFNEILIIAPSENQDIDQKLATCDESDPIGYVDSLYGTIPICDFSGNGAMYTMLFKVENTWHFAFLTNVDILHPNSKETRITVANIIFESIKIID